MNELGAKLDNFIKLFLVTLCLVLKDETLRSQGYPSGTFSLLNSVNANDIVYLATTN